MLSPTVNQAKTQLTAAASEILKIDGYAGSVRGLQIGQLPDDPDWLISVRSRVGLLSAAAGQWFKAKPDIWGPVLSQFATYEATIAAIAQMQAEKQVTTGQQWADLLSQTLAPQLAAAAAATDAATTALQEQLNAFADIQPLLEDSIQDGWTALAAEEQQMVKISAELARLEDLVGSLGDALTSSAISDGKGVISTAVSIVYDVAVAGSEAVPFLAFVTSAITIGRFFADIAEGSAEVQSTLKQIAQLQLDASLEAQAAAGTKSVLQLLYGLQASFNTIADVLPQITQMWRSQLDLVQQAASALNDGADPSGLFDLLTLQTSAANWRTIASFANAVVTLKTGVGEPVELNPQKAGVA